MESCVFQLTLQQFFPSRITVQHGFPCTLHISGAGGIFVNRIETIETASRSTAVGRHGCFFSLGEEVKRLCARHVRECPVIPCFVCWGAMKEQFPFSPSLSMRLRPSINDQHKVQSTGFVFALASEMC